jgi:hypothetical protein
MNKIKLINAVSIIDDEIGELEDELTFLRAAKKNLEVLINKPLPQQVTKKDTEP